jgi:hypothetical protein
MSSIAVNAITDASAGNTATINSVTPNTSNVVGKNRIINGNMMIDQRNAGASITPTGGVYALDRWAASINVASKFSLQQNAGSVTPPEGFSKYLGITSLSAYTLASGEFCTLTQYIEGSNVDDLNWGTSNAKAVTLSFWVRSSLTGTFGGAFNNSDSSRSYPFTYSISSVNTWEKKSITIAGDTTGTWLTTNGRGIGVRLGFGSGSTYSGTAGSWSGSTYFTATGATSVVGTSGATFYITGVQLEAGSSATEFEHRQYGTELQLCQRYYEVGGGVTATALGTGGIYTQWGFKVTKRAASTITNSRSVSASGDLINYWYQASNDSGSIPFTWQAAAEL